jgi:PAS domain-containing protein
MDEELYFSLIDEHLAREHAVGVILLNPDKQIVSVSGAAEALLGVTMAEAAGHRCEEVLQFDLCATSCPFETVLSEGRVITRGTVLCSHVLKEPRTIWFP